MKAFISFLFIMSCSFFSAQTKTTEQQSTALTEKEKSLCKSWKLAFIEEFGTKNPPRNKEKNDGITFMDDRTMMWIIQGKTYSGKWKMDKAGKNIIIETEESVEADYPDKKKITFSILQLDNSNLSVKFQWPSLVTTTHHFQEKKN